jgi:hypothetical protein
MDPRTEELLNNSPEQPTRSKLEPYRELIRELRRRRYTYRKIAALLQDSLGVKTSKSTINDFVIARSKPHRLPFQIPKEPSSPDASPETSANQTTNSDVYARIEALKKKARERKPERKPLFEYTEGTPLTLIPPTRKD